MERRESVVRSASWAASLSAVATVAVNDEGFMEDAGACRWRRVECFIPGGLAATASELLTYSMFTVQAQVRVTRLTKYDTRDIF